MTHQARFGDFDGGRGQQTIHTAVDDTPKRPDDAETVGDFREQHPDGKGAIARWSNGQQTVEIVRVTGDDSTTFEVQAEHHDRELSAGRLIEEAPSEAAARAQAHDYMRSQV